MKDSIQDSECLSTLLAVQLNQRCIQTISLRELSQPSTYKTFLLLLQCLGTAHLLIFLNPIKQVFNVARADQFQTISVHWHLNIVSIQKGEQILKVVNEGTAGARKRKSHENIENQILIVT